MKTVPADKENDAATSHEALRRCARRLAAAVAVVTTCDLEGRPFGLTMSAFTCLSLEPPLFLICVSDTADTLPVLLQRRAFAINILRRDQHALAQRFAQKGGTDKFRCFEYVEGVLPGIPLLANTLAVIECELFAAHSGGDHRVVIGKVRAARAHAGEPLLYYRGGYRSIDAAEERLAGLPNGTKRHLRALEPHLMSAR